jgi:hypothetical protein
MNADDINDAMTVLGNLDEAIANPCANIDHRAAVLTVSQYINRITKENDALKAELARLGFETRDAAERENLP